MLWRFEGGETWAETGRAEGRFLFRFPRRAEFTVAHRRITATRLGHCPPENFRHLLLDTILPLALASEGRLVLHGSAVSAPGVPAVVLCGLSGAGKSTLTAALSRQGWSILADDGVLIEEADPVRAVPSYPGLRLWPDSAEATGFHDGHRAPVSGNSTKMRVAVDECAGASSGTLRAIYVLAEDSAFAIEALTPRDSVAEIVRHAFRADLHDRVLLARQLEQAVALAAAVPVWRVRMPRDFTRLATSAARLGQHVVESVADPAAVRC